MEVLARQIPRRGDPQCGGESRAGVARAVGVVLGFGAGEEPADAFELADRVDALGPAREQFVDVSLVGHVEDQLVLRSRENPVQGDGQLDDAEVGAEVAAGARKNRDERIADFPGERRELLVVEFRDILRPLDLREKGAEQRFVR